VSSSVHSERAAGSSRRGLVRERLLGSPGRVQGIFVKLPSTQVIDVVAGSQFDFAIVDLEHSQISDDDALRLVRHAWLVDLPVLVRVTSVERGLVNRLLEAGADGVQLSTVRGARQVRDLVAATRYAPDGTRSIGVAHPAARYGARDVSEYLAEQRAAPPIVVAQIETCETDDSLDDILRAGVDVAFVGTLDLTVDVDGDAARVAARTAQIAAAAKAAGVVFGGANCDHPDVVYAADHADLGLLRAACGRAGESSARAPIGSLGRSEAPLSERAEIEELLVEFAYRLDVGRGELVHELFEPGGTYIVDGRPLSGREAIRDGYAARAAQGPRTARHIFSNLRIEPVSAGRLRAQSVVVIYAEDGEPVHPAGAPLVVGDFTDVCVRGGDGRWRFERRELRTLFQGDGPVRSPTGAQARPPTNKWEQA
jgi:4-hydroxy-2-oxoheptanedioate aldolase